MRTIRLSLNKIVERYSNAMLWSSKQGFDCVYSYKDKVSRDKKACKS